MSKTTKQIVLGSVLFLSLVVLPTVVFGQFKEPPTTTITSLANVQSLLNTILSWIYIIFFIVAAIFIILAAFGYLSAQGDEEKVRKAKQQLIYAIVAIVIALIAVGVDNIVAGLISVQPPQ